MNLDYVSIFAIFVDLCKAAMPIAIFLYLLNKEPKLIDLLLFENDKIDYEEKSINIDSNQTNKSYYVSYIKKDSIK